MDPWKPIRLWVCVGVIAAFLAVGGYARLRWGVPEIEPRYANPLFRLELDFAAYERQRLLNIPVPLSVGPTICYGPIISDVPEVPLLADPFSDFTPAPPLPEVRSEDPFSAPPAP
jgi:hypothetical protein